MILATVLPLPAESGAGAGLRGEVLAKGTETRLPAVRVAVTGPAGRGETLTDGLGSYRFAALPPGGYTITASRQGFDTLTVAVRLSAGEPRVLNLHMEVLRAAESVTVTASPEPAAPAVTATQLHALPTNSRNPARFALLDARVRHTQGLGGDGAVASRLSINAASFRHTSHSLDGASNYDSVFANAPRQGVPAAAVQEVRVSPDPYDASHGGSTAGSVAVLTRAGGEQFHGEAFAFLRPGGVQARAPLSNLDTENRRLQYGAAAGGPAIPGRTWLFGAVEASAQRRGSFIQSPAPRTFTGHQDEWLALARVDHRWNRRHSLTLRLNAQHWTNDNSNDRISGFTQPSAMQLNYGQSAGVQANWRAAGPRMLNEVRLSWTAYTPSATRTLYPSVAVVRPSYSIEGGSANTWVHARAAQISETAGWQTGRHQIHAGADLQRQAVRDFSFSPFGEYRFAAGAPTPGQQPQQYSQTFGEANLRYGQSYGAAFLHDEWRATPRLTASLGLRYERQSITDDRNNLAPRAGLAWDLTGNGRTVLRAGAGLFYDQYYFYIVRRFHLQGMAAPTAAYTIPFGTPGFPVFPEPLTTAPAGLDGARRDLYLRPGRVLNPYSLQWSLSLTRESGRGWTASLEAMHSHTLRQMRADDLNAPAPFPRTAPGQFRTAAQADATRPLTDWGSVPARNVLIIENSGASLYDSLQLGLARQFARRYQFRAQYVWASSATYSMFFGEPNTGNPNEWSNTGAAERGPSDFHQRHRLVATSTAALPWGVRLSGVATLGSGLPVNPLTGKDNNGDTFTADRPAGMGRNSFRGPAHAAVDLAAARTFRLREPLTLELRAEAFNALNRNNYLKLNNIYGDAVRPRPLFLTPVAGLLSVDPSRQLQLGLRLAW